MDLIPASDIKKQLDRIIKRVEFKHLNPRRIFCMRSFKSSSRARARIWAFPRIWQMALQSQPAYVIEVLAEKYDHLSDTEKTKTLIHELLHIPKNFSGSLLPHRGRGRLSIDVRTNQIYDYYFPRR
jgi:predicted metallopeptidase